MQFADALLFTAPSRLPCSPDGIGILPLKTDSPAAYSAFMLPGLLSHIASSHLLVVHWDGFVLDAVQRDPAFLQHDCIGAPLRGGPLGRAVGNGGFLLRSRRLLMALKDLSLAIRHPKDICICHDHRARPEAGHGIRFASRDLAQRLAPVARTQPGHHPPH